MQIKTGVPQPQKNIHVITTFITSLVQGDLISSF